MFRNGNKNLLENLYFYFLFSILAAKNLPISQLKQERILKRELIRGQTQNKAETKDYGCKNLSEFFPRFSEVAASGCRPQTSGPVFKNNGPGELLSTAAWMHSNCENQVICLVPNSLFAFDLWPFYPGRAARKHRSYCMHVETCQNTTAFQAGELNMNLPRFDTIKLS